MFVQSKWCPLTNESIAQGIVLNIRLPNFRSLVVQGFEEINGTSAVTNSDIPGWVTSEANAAHAPSHGQVPALQH